VSYHRAHSVQVGAVAAIVGQGNVFVISSLASILIQVEAVNVSCLVANQEFKSDVVAYQLKSMDVSHILVRCFGHCSRVIGEEDITHSAVIETLLDELVLGM
jgi:hypothetical protein